jgi:uncharacterized protein (DUF952 family)
MDFRQQCCLHVSVPDGSRGRPDRFIFHIAFESDWRAAERDGEYRVSTRGKRLEDVGFIHAGFEHQVLDVGAAFYRDAPEPLAVLVIDTGQLDVPVVVENLEGGDEGFPHIYGALPARAVVEVRPAGVTSAGEFVISRPVAPEPSP